MENKASIKSAWILLVFGGLLSVKFLYPETGGYKGLALDGLIAVSLLAIGPRALYTCFLFSMPLYSKAKKLFRNSSVKMVGDNGLMAGISPDAGPEPMASKARESHTNPVSGRF